MIAYSFELTAHILKSKLAIIRSTVFHRWFCGLVVSCLTCDRKVGSRTVGGSIPCQENTKLSFRSKIILHSAFRLQ